MNQEFERDRRSHARTPFILKVEYPTKEGFLHDYSVNISRGGILIRTPRNLKVDEVVDLLLSFPRLMGQIALRGKVRWVRTEEDGENAVGVKFLEDDDRAWRDLQLLVDRIVAGDERVVAPSGVRLLVAEDNEHVAYLISSGLEAVGRRSSDKTAFEVTHAEDGAKAWEAVKTGNYDLLICDADLPVIDGLNLIQRIRSHADHGQIPIIVLSNDGDPDARYRALTAGADFFLTKPFRLTDLLNTMHSLLVLRHGNALPS